MTVCYAPRYDGKEENSDFRPVTVTGTPEELNEEWSKAISEIAKNEHLLIAASSTSNLSKRKTETEKALTKTSKIGTAATKKTDSGSAADNSLFTPANKENKQKTEPAESSISDLRMTLTVLSRMKHLRKLTPLRKTKNLRNKKPQNRQSSNSIQSWR